MTDTNESIDADLLMDLTTRIVTAYAGNTALSPSELNDTIAAVANALRSVGGREVAAPNPEQIPAVPIKKSVTADFIVCLEDGKKLKMLKRHLKTAYGMTPAEYRTKWRLPHDYPMTAPGYAARRSSLAKATGLGRSTPAKGAATRAEPQQSEAPKRGRPKKAPASPKSS